MLKQLRAANLRRHEEWAKGGDVPLSFRGLELAGEAGELCNALKKAERITLGIAGGHCDMTNIRDEIADVLISLLSLALAPC